MILEGLTDGLPTELKSLMTINAPSDPISWLTHVHKLIKISENQQIKSAPPRFVTPIGNSPQDYNRFNRSRISATVRQDSPRPNNFQRFQRPSNFYNRFSGPGFTSHHNYNSQNRLPLPPSPCRLCTRNGIPNAFHWFQVCPFRRERSDTPNVTPLAIEPTPETPHSS